jgi:hypothetical protein
VKGKPKRDGDEVTDDEFTVYVEPLVGVDREGALWFELTETLMYPGTNYVSLRVKSSDAAAPPDANASPQTPYVGIELLPTGPRVDAVRISRDASRGELVVTIDLMRPKGFMLIPGPPVSTIPLSVKMRLDDAATGEAIQRSDHAIGPMPDNTRTVSLRVPWSATPGAAPPKQARLRVRLASTAGRLFDEPYPVELKLADLPPAKDE